MAPTSTGCASQRLDVTDPDSIELPDDLRVLVNNAGVEDENLPLEVMPAEVWRKLFETNVFGLVEVTKRAVPIMRAGGGGVICNVTSSSTLAPVPFLGAYRASKAAVSAIGESLRAEVAPFGIRVVEIMPGPDRDRHARDLGPARAPRSSTSRIARSPSGCGRRARASATRTRLRPRPRVASPTRSRTTTGRCATAVTT